MGLNHLKHSEVNREEWLNIHRSEREAIYSHPSFLDVFSPKWEAMIKEGKIYMPLPVKKIIGIKYLVQPAFCQQIGPFGPAINSEDEMHSLLKSIAFKFPRINIYLNQNARLLNAGTLKLHWRSNYCLDLKREYSDLRLAFSTNLKRNLKKGLKASLEIKNLKMNAAYDFYLENTLKAKGIKNIKEKQRKQLLQFINTEGDIQFSAQGVFKASKLISVVVWATLYHRSYYFLSGSNEKGKELGAASFLIDRFLQAKRDEMEILDFEGSMIPGLARFYSSFGAKRYSYAHVWKKRKIR